MLRRNLSRSLDGPPSRRPSVAEMVQPSLRFVRAPGAMTAQTSASAGWVQRRRPAPAESPDALAALDPTITAAMQAHAASTASYRRVKDCGNIPLPVSLAARHPARRTCDGIRAPHATARQTIALTRVARSCLRLLWRHSDHQKSSCGRVRQGLRAGAVEATLHRQPGAPAPSGAGPALGDKRVSDQRPDACFHGRMLHRPHARFATRPHQGRRRRARAAAQFRALVDPPAGCT
jgi:hypothetical protein